MMLKGNPFLALCLPSMVSREKIDYGIMLILLRTRYPGFGVAALNVCC